MKIDVICEICNKTFQREKSEVNRNKKLGRKIYCSLVCAGKGNLDNIPVEKRHNISHLKPGSKTDEYSPFRFHMKCIKNHGGSGGHRKPCEITLQDLKEQWDKQKGICPYTGWQLKNATSMTEQLERTPDRASVDRIDSSLPYTKDNVQFISLMAQYAKNGWAEEELYNFCKAVVENEN